MQLPPPVHGASVVNKSIMESALINSAFDTQFLNISPATELTDIGNFTFKKIILFLKILSKSIQLHLKFKPDLVYLTLSPHGLGFYKDGVIALAIKMLGGKLVFHLHGKGIREAAKKNKINNLIYKLIFKNASVIHLADCLFYDVEPVRDHTKPIMAISNGLDENQIVHVIEKHPVFTFVYLSNLVRAKGADVLINAASLVYKTHPEQFKIKIIGKISNFTYKAELDSLITSELANTISFLGPLYGADKMHELSSAHVFVLPTKNDCFPLSILEAMASGLAVISTTEGAIPDIVDHTVTGEVLQNTTPEALAASMIRFIDNPSYYESCSLSGQHKFISNYTKNIFEHNLTAELNKLASS